MNEDVYTLSSEDEQERKVDAKPLVTVEVKPAIKKKTKVKVLRKDDK